MGTQRNERVLLRFLLAFLLPQAAACGGSSSPGYGIPHTDKFSFKAECDGSKSISETTEQALMENGFSIAAMDCGSIVETFNDIAVFDKESGLFRTEGFYSRDPGKMMDFYAAWPCEVAIGADGRAGITVQEIDGETDIVAASALSEDCGNESVKLNFKHILGRIRIFARGIDPGMEYTLAGLSLTIPGGGHYNFSTGQWNDFGYQTIQISEGDDITAIPGTVLITADWSCEYEQVVIASYHRTASVDIKEGRITTVTLLLSNDGAEELCFDAELSLWMGNAVPVDL